MQIGVRYDVTETGFVWEMTTPSREVREDLQEVQGPELGLKDQELSR